MSTRSSGSRGRGDKSLSLQKYVLRTKEWQTTAFPVVRRTYLSSERNLFPRSYPRVLAAVTAGLLLMALPVIAKPLPKIASVQTAGIENSGSTNTFGYTIAISSNYGARVNGAHRVPILSHLPKTMTDKFFADLAAALPLTNLPVHHGMRSASFGTQTFIIYKGQKSPDLTFAADPRTSPLKIDIEEITRWLGVGSLPRHPVSKKAL